jgi:hypothetical protein
MSAPLTSRRDAPVICAGCGRQVARQARQQRFCSARCKEKARTRARGPTLTTPTPVENNERTGIFAHGPPEKLNEINRAFQAKIRGPKRVIDVEVWGGRDWQSRTSSGGVPIEVSRIRARALVSS